MQNILVQTNLLLHEKEFDLLREFISNLDESKLTLLDKLVYDMEKDSIVLINELDSRGILSEISSGFILINFDDLKKFFSK